MEVSTKMIQAAVRQAVKDKLLPTHAPIDIYIEHCEAVKRMIESALEQQDQ